MNDFPPARTLVLTASGAVPFADGLDAFDGTGGGSTPTPTPTPAPSFTSGPTIGHDGSPRAGETLNGLETVANGSVTARAWYRNSTAISGANGASYVPASAGDYAYEPRATGPGGSTTLRSAAVTVAAPPAPSLTAPSNVSKNEGAAGTTTDYSFDFPLNRDGSTAAYPYSWAVTGITANPADGTDFVGGALPSGSGTYASNQSLKTVVVSVQGDATVEFDERFRVTFTVPGVGTVTADGTIVNDDTAGPVTGDPMSFAVRGPTEFDPQFVNGTDGTAYGVNGDGWVGELVFKGMGTGQTFDATKVTVTVEDPGYDNAGNAVTRVRTIRGGRALREQYPNHQNAAIYAQGADVLVRFSLSEYIYAGSTITGVTVAAGAYGASNAKAVATTTQGSQLAYPKPLFAWLQPPLLRQTGNTFFVEASAFHQLGRGGQMVACIKYQATDGTNSTPEVTSGTAALSTLVTNGRTPECFPGTIDCSALTQGAICYVNAKVYPWIGNAASVLNLDVDGVAWPTPNPQTRLHFLCDRTGAYGGVYAYVKLGASGGSVSTNAATARTTPYPDMEQALNGIRAANQARGHDDAGGAIVRLMDDNGNPAVHPRKTSNVKPGACWWRMERDPAATASVTLKTVENFQFTTANWQLGGNGLIFDATTPDIYNMLGNDGGTGDLELSMLLFDDLNVVAKDNVADYVNRFYVRNTTITGTGSWVKAGPGVTQMWGVVARGLTTNLPQAVSVMIGCRLCNAAGGYGGPNLAEDGIVIYNNELLRSVGVAIGDGITGNPAIVRGVAFVQNVVEYEGNGGPTIATYFNDGNVKPVQNMLDAYNMIVGERGNRMYCDTSGSAGILKRGAEMYSVVHNWNLKADRFDEPGAGRGRTGNWAFAFGVGKRAVMSLFGSKAGTAVDNTGGYMGEYWPPDSETYQAGKGALPTYVRYAARTPEQLAGGTAGVGDGDYRPTGANNPLYNRVAAGMGALKYDLNGLARRTDGSGAIGPFERTV